jgi:hypothetical protein
VRDRERSVANTTNGFEPDAAGQRIHTQRSGLISRDASHPRKLGLDTPSRNAARPRAATRGMERTVDTHVKTPRAVRTVDPTPTRSSRTAGSAIVVDRPAD